MGVLGAAGVMAPALPSQPCARILHAFLCSMAMPAAGMLGALRRAAVVYFLVGYLSYI